MNNFEGLKKKLSKIGRILALSSVFAMPPATLLTAGYFLSRQPEPLKPEDYDYFDQSYSDLEKKIQYLNNEPETIELNYAEQKNIERELKGEYGDFAYLEFKKTVEKMWIVPYENPIEAQKKLEDSLKSVDDLFNFIDSPLIKKPKIKIVVPKKAEEIQEEADSEEIKVYLVKLFGKNRITEYLLYKFGKTIENTHVQQDISAAGMTGVEIFNYENLETKLMERRSKLHNIFVLETKKPVVELSCVPEEVLHTAMLEHTMKNISRIIVKHYFSENSVIDLVIKHEEGLVHAIGSEWLNQSKQKYSIKERDIEVEYRLIKSSPKHRLIEKYTQLIKKFGIKKTIDLYAKGKTIE